MRGTIHVLYHVYVTVHRHTQGCIVLTSSQKLFVAVNEDIMTSVLLTFRISEK